MMVNQLINCSRRLKTTGAQLERSKVSVLLGVYGRRRRRRREDKKQPCRIRLFRQALSFSSKKEKIDELAKLPLKVCNCLYYIIYGNMTTIVVELTMEC